MNPRVDTGFGNATLGGLDGFVKKMEQKILYMHNNLLHKRWNLASRPEAYGWSLAHSNESGNDEFTFLTHYLERYLRVRQGLWGHRERIRGTL